MEDSEIAKYSDDKKIDLANQLRTLGLPKKAGVLIIVTHNIGVATFEKMPTNVCRVLCAGAEDGWHHLSFKQTEMPTTEKKIRKFNWECWWAIGFNIATIFAAYFGAYVL